MAGSGGREEPRIVWIRGGFVALGDGWAVVGQTERQAREAFTDAQIRHETIQSRPDPHPWPIAPDVEALRGV
jgi:hypothetical protein